MSNFHTGGMDPCTQISQRDATPKREDLIIGLDLIEIQIGQIKSLSNHNDYYSSIIDEIVSNKTGLKISPIFF